jgi:hypothetical protein
MNRLRTTLARIWAWFTAPANSRHGGGWDAHGDDE